MKRSNLKRSHSKLKRSKIKKPKAHTHSWWFKKTKEDFNKLIRLRDSGSNGMCKCVTCSKILHYTEANASHYIHGLNFIEDNQHASCARCNLFLSGNLAKYTLYMIDRYGRERVDELHQEGHNPHKYLVSELKDMRERYKQTIKNLEAEKL